MKCIKEPLELWDRNGTWLIILDDTGLLFTNQCGGYACNHPEARGFLVPANHLLGRVYFHFEETLLSHCDSGISHPIADLLDTLLDTHDLLVDRERLADCQEAWVYVKLPDGRKAVLTWENSD